MYNVNSAAIAGKLPLPVPMPVYVGLDDDPHDPWSFFGAPLIPGTELAMSQLPDAARVPAARAASEFLRVLHGPVALADAQAAVAEQLPQDPMHRAWPRARMADTRGLIRSLVKLGSWVADQRVEQLLEDAAGLEEPRSPSVLAHGDLHIRHLLVDLAGGAAAATGVIDWGDICVGDPAIDLSLGFAAFSGNARHAFLDAYGAIDDECELRARALAVRLSAHPRDLCDQHEPARAGRGVAQGLHRAVT